MPVLDESVIEQSTSLVGDCGNDDLCDLRLVLRQVSERGRHLRTGRNRLVRLLAAYRQFHRSRGWFVAVDTSVTAAATLKSRPGRQANPRRPGIAVPSQRGQR